jgi:hypothetical protein
VYFGDLETAETYGKHIVTAEIDTKNYIDSRKDIGKYVKVDKITDILSDMLKADQEAMYYMITDWGVEISEPEDIEYEHLEFLADKMQNDEVRNFQVTLAETFEVEPFVASWNKHLPKIHGTFQPQNRDIWYCVINTKVKVKSYQA